MVKIYFNDTFSSVILDMCQHVKMIQYREKNLLTRVALHLFVPVDLTLHVLFFLLELKEYSNSNSKSRNFVKPWPNLTNALTKLFIAWRPSGCKLTKIQNPSHSLASLPSFLENHFYMQPNSKWLTRECYLTASKDTKNKISPTANFAVQRSEIKWVGIGLVQGNRKL